METGLDERTKYRQTVLKYKDLVSNDHHKICTCRRGLSCR